MPQARRRQLERALIALLIRPRLRVAQRAKADGRDPGANLDDGSHTYHRIRRKALWCGLVSEVPTCYLGQGARRGNAGAHGHVVEPGVEDGAKQRGIAWCAAGERREECCENRVRHALRSAPARPSMELRSRWRAPSGSTRSLSMGKPEKEQKRCAAASLPMPIIELDPGVLEVVLHLHQQLSELT